MNRIAVECPNCRVIEDVAASCLLLEVGSASAEDGSSCASWICGTCNRLVALPVDLTALIVLVSVGAPVLDTALEDARPAYPENVVEGPALTRDDLLDFHERLEDCTWLAVVLDQP